MMCPVRLAPKVRKVATVHFLEAAGGEWRLRATTSNRAKLWTFQSNIHLSFDIVPFASLPQPVDQLFECVRVLRGVLKPSQEIERLAEFAAMV